jgi:hypothetical protein
MNEVTEEYLKCCVFVEKKIIRTGGSNRGHWAITKGRGVRQLKADEDKNTRGTDKCRGKFQKRERKKRMWS